MSVEKVKTFYCYTEMAMDILGGKWKPIIIYHLENKKAIRFGEFKRLIPNVNERVLSRQLRELEDQEIIHREDYNENPPRVEYSLTSVGEEISPIILELGKWGKSYNKRFNYAEIHFANNYEDDNC